MTNEIRKQAILKAPRDRVWRAISDTSDFATWFRMTLDGPFEPGRTLKGRVDFPQYAHLTFTVVVEKVEPKHHVSWRWHPHALDEHHDYSAEPMTLVSFDLEDAEGGTMLTIVESGFDAIPAERRETAFRGNEGGWTGQLKNITAHVERDA